VCLSAAISLAIFGDGLLPVETTKQQERMKVDNFTLIDEVYVAEIDSKVKQWRHDQTHAEVLSFLNSDENKAFGVTFKTPPSDSRGLAHILEHTVLCGSRKYNVKRPFAELLKSSLYTYLNAITYPDRTCYFAASTNLKDLQNLKDVYLDAVFHPLLREEVFMQEGWHASISQSNELVFNGVVYNEIKGAFSAPEHILTCQSFHSLFPNTIYRHAAGGTPADIPLSSYEELVAYHKRHYHPSNAYFIFWGDDDESDRLRHLSKIINRFQISPPDAAATLQAPFQTPAATNLLFEDASGGNKGLISWNWLLADSTDTTTCISMRVLELILIGFPTSPLYQALMGSGLGEDLILNGVITEMRNWAFSIGMRGVAPANFKRLEKLVTGTLRQLVEKPINLKLIQAAMNTMEFALRENNTGYLPIGISIMQRVLTSWIYGGNPLSPLRFSSSLQQIKDKIMSGNLFFENLITKYLILNPHRTIVTMIPTKYRLNNHRSEGERVHDTSTIKAKTTQLQSYHAMVDTPKKLSTVPRLALTDIRKTLPTFSSSLCGPSMQILLHELPTRGICYVEAALDVTTLPLRLFGFLPLFARSIFEMDPVNFTRGAFSIEVACKTGGGSAYPLVLAHRNGKETIAKLVLTIKSTYRNIPELFDLLTTAIMDIDFNNFERFNCLLKEELSVMEQTVASSGESIIPDRLGSIYSTRCMIEEQMGGLEYLNFLRILNKKLYSEWDNILNELKYMHTLIVKYGRLLLNITCDPEHSELALKYASCLINNIPCLGDARKDISGVRQPKNHFEAFIVPSDVNAIGVSADIYSTGYTYHGSELVILKYLQNSWLWDEIRVKGGAYASSCSLDPVSGAVIMFSERDPNIAKTFKTFQAAPHYLSRLSLAKLELEAAIVGASASIDTCLLPEARGHEEFILFLTGQTREVRQRILEEVLTTRLKDFRLFAERLDAALDHGAGIVVGGKGIKTELTGHQEWSITQLFQES